MLEIREHLEIRLADRPRACQDLVSTFFSSTISSTNRLINFLINYYLIYQVYPARARAPLGPPGAKVRLRIVGGSGFNVRKPIFGRLVVVFVRC